MADQGRRDRPSRRARQDGLVRPYVLGGRAGRRSPQPPPPPSDPRIISLGTPVAGPGAVPPYPTFRRPDGDVWPATRPLPAIKPAGYHRNKPAGGSAGPGGPSGFGSLGSPSGPAGPGSPDEQQLRPSGRPRQLAAILAGGTAIALLAGVVLLLSQHPSHTLASTCAARRCEHSGPTARPTLITPTATPTPARHDKHKARHSANRRKTPTATPTPTPSKRPHTPSPTPKPTHKSATPRPSPTRTTTKPSPSPTPTKQVQVSYAVAHQWRDGFKGVFTIVNKGSTSVSGWKLSAVLPNDTVTLSFPISVQLIGSTLIVQALAGQETIAPGGTFTEVIFATGQATTPTSCTFNGSPC